MAVSSRVAPSLGSVAWSAFRAGGCSVLVWRLSHRSFSGRVLVASFGCPVVASSFARRWAARLGVAVAVRRSSAGWSVSVPVAPWSGLGHGVVVVRGRLGGVRAVAQAVRLVASPLPVGFGV